MEDKKELTKDLLTLSFKELLMKTSFEKITIKMITDGAGVIRPTFYKHFQDKYEIIEYILEKEIKDKIQVLLDNNMEDDKIKISGIYDDKYLKMDKERESLFFQIIRQRYEKSSLIITTNLPMGRWDELFTGKLAAAAILDRLVHHCHVISITGDSYRVKGPKTEY
mgnify:CR=1 FL=1